MVQVPLYDDHNLMIYVFESHLRRVAATTIFISTLWFQTISKLTALC